MGGKQSPLEGLVTMKKVLITGGAGFIGAPVTDELLKRGYEVHSVIFNTRAPEHPNLVQHQMSLMDTSAVELLLSEHRFEHLIHLAWYVGAKCHTSNVNLDWALATLGLLQGFHKYGGKIFLGAGTVSEYDYSYGYLQEHQTPITATTLYGQTKASIHNMAKIFCTQNDIIFKWPRVFNLYGPNEKPSRLMPSVAQSMLKGEDVKVSDCLKYQDYLHVLDAARGIVDLFESDVSGAVNISSGVPIQLRAIVNKIAELTNFKGNILWGAIPTSFDDPLVVGSNNRLVKEVGWRQQISLDDGLQDIVDFWRKHNV